MIGSGLLEAAALALAALAVLFSLWAPHIEGALRQDRKQHREDREPAIDLITQTQRLKALPLAVGASLVLITITPPAIQIAIDSVKWLLDHGPRALRDYSAEQALFFVVWLLTIGLVVETTANCRRLRDKLKNFRKPDTGRAGPSPTTT